MYHARPSFHPHQGMNPFFLEPRSMSSYLFTSESVSEGHPDKVADQISDAVLDAIIAQDPRARVACETMVKTGVAIVAGEVTTSAWSTSKPSRARSSATSATPTRMSASTAPPAACST